MPCGTWGPPPPRVFDVSGGGLEGYPLSSLGCPARRAMSADLRGGLVWGAHPRFWGPVHIHVSARADLSTSRVEGAIPPIAMFGPPKNGLP